MKLTACRHFPPQVTFIEAMDNLMPGFDREIARVAQRLLIQVTGPVSLMGGDLVICCSAGHGAG